MTNGYYMWWICGAISIDFHALSRRYDVDLPCRLTVTGHGVVNARVINISEGGARIEGAATVPAGARGMLGFDGVGVPLPLTVRHNDGGVLGIGFEPDEMASAALRSMLERLAARLAA